MPTILETLTAVSSTAPSFAQEVEATLRSSGLVVPEGLAGTPEHILARVAELPAVHWLAPGEHATDTEQRSVA